MTIQVGRTYANAHGRVVRIVAQDCDPNGQQRFVDDVGNCYLESGRFAGNCSAFDLVIQLYAPENPLPELVGEILWLRKYAADLERLIPRNP